MENRILQIMKFTDPWQKGLLELDGQRGLYKGCPKVNTSLNFAIGLVCKLQAQL